MPTLQVHGSMYRYLRTNLPREIMGFSDFPFTPSAMGAAAPAGRLPVDARRFPGHAEVLRYLEAFAERFELHGAIRLNTRVLQVSPLQGCPEEQQPALSARGSEQVTRWRVRSCKVANVGGKAVVLPGSNIEEVGFPPGTPECLSRVRIQNSLPPDALCIPAV